jgi:putative transposase
MSSRSKEAAAAKDGIIHGMRYIAKCSEEDYINFLIASPKVVSCTEAARVQPDQPDPPAHDSFTRLLRELKPDPHKLWQEAQPLVNLQSGLLIIDDTMLDKPYAHKMALLYRLWSGKHHDVVQGINLITLLWSDGECHIPCDYRLYDKDNDALSKNDHFVAMLEQAAARGFKPGCVAFDSWYSRLENLKVVREHHWVWLTQFKSNRQVNPDGSGNRAIREVEIGSEGRIVHLRGYGFIKVFKMVAQDGDIEYWATNDLQMSEATRQAIARARWKIEAYHRGLKQYCGVERAQVRQERSQRNHIGLAIRAFLRLELARLKTERSWFESKTSIVREAVRAYLAAPAMTMLPNTMLLHA